MSKTFYEANENLTEAIKDFVFAFSKALGVVRLIEKTPFLELREWVKRRNS